jgi:osmoprotectant transport system ATP-binding protein
MVTLEDVQKTVDGREIISPTTLEVGRSQTLALIGPSGSGKSTLLKMVLGLVVPDRGAVTVDGTRVTPASALSVRRRVGYVIQEGGLFPHMTARDNASLVARLSGWEPDRLRARVDELCALVRLPIAALERHPGELSGGERQRVGLVRALVLDPPVLLLDEPLGALGPLVRAALQSDLREIIRELSKCVVFVTHDMAEAAYFGDEIALLRDGRVVQRAPMRELIDAPAEPFVTEFVNAQRSLVEALA